jgi:cell wall-associated NlpC family hydrolase
MIDLEKLEASARAWVGTPYRDNGCTRGGAASCHGLVWALYREAGWDHGMVLGHGPSRWAGRRTDSPLCDYMAGQSDKFDAIRPAGDVLSVCAVEPGDMLGFKLGSQVAHAGIALRGLWFVHALRHYGVGIRSLSDPTYSRRLAILWRPREEFLE